MHNLFTSSFGRSRNGGDLERGQVQMQQHGATAGTNLDQFYQDVEVVKDGLKELEDLEKSLHDANETAKSLHQSSAVRALRKRMDADVTKALNKARFIKDRLEALDRENAANRSLPDCGPGSSTDRTRTTVVGGLRTKLRDTMGSFNALRERVGSEYRETVERRYYTVTGSKPDETTLDTLISTGEAERFFQLAIQQEGGRGEVMDVVAEIHERYGATKQLERSLQELHQVFLDMSVLVAAQGEQLNEIDKNVERADSFVRRGTEHLQVARKHQKSTRRCTCIAIILLLIIIIVVVVPIVTSIRKK